MDDKYSGPPPVMQQPSPYGQAPPYGGQMPPISGQSPYGGQPPYGSPPPFGGQAPPYGGEMPYGASGGLAVAPPQPPPGCPPGLQYLAMVDQLVVKQKVELLEAFTGFETANKYKVFNSMGQLVYDAKEQTDCCTRQVCGPGRPFDMSITDHQGMEVIHLERPLRCQLCCCPCCLQELDVSSSQGGPCGKVEQQWTLIYPKFVIKDATGEPVLRIEGPLCPISCCGSDVEFKVVSVQTGGEVGMITKQWSGFGKEAFTDADNFGISFPLDLDVKVKATLLGALFLIDFMFFEQKQDNNHDY